MLLAVPGAPYFGTVLLSVSVFVLQNVIIQESLNLTLWKCADGAGLLWQVARLHCLERSLLQSQMLGSNHYFLGTYQCPGTPIIIPFTHFTNGEPETQSSNHVAWGHAVGEWPGLAGDPGLLHFSLPKAWTPPCLLPCPSPGFLVQPSPFLVQTADLPPCHLFLNL